MADQVWEKLSNELAQRAENGGGSVVAIHGRRHPSSGVVVGKDSMVTVNHALRRDEDITVVVAPGQSIAARVAGRDPGTDLAVLRLAQPVTSSPPRWGDASRLRVGELVLALGRSWRGNVVASSGILSGLIAGPWRTWHGGELEQFVRPDLTLYPGFSGGPLLNSAGEFVGINTAALYRSGITIPAGTVQRVATELLEKGRVERPYVGLAMQTVALPESLRDKLNLKPMEALLVAHVETGSPAEKAGVLLGDVLLELEGKPVADTNAVQEVLRSGKIGREVGAVLIRGGGIVKMKVMLEARPSR